jgi:mRNA-degrading endonuclease RelE of RelBE toxin-antitoxin system
MIFNATSAAEMSALPKGLQLELLAEFRLFPNDFKDMKGHFGVLCRGHRKLFRYRSKDYRIYFEQHPEGVLIHRVLHKNTLQDFLFRSSLTIAEEDKRLGATNAFWKLIEEGQKPH